MDAATISTLNTTVTVVGFIATIASLILAVGAIWLSIIFYKMSDAASKETTTAAKDIKASVERLENLFDKLYSDTFAMMKDTVTDMRQHIWKKPGSNNEQTSIDEKIANEIKESVSQEIIKAVEDRLKDLGDNSNKINELESSIKEILDSNLEASLKKNIIIPRSVLRRRLLSIMKRYRKIKVDKLFSLMNSLYQESFDMKDTELMGEIFRLRESGVIVWDGSPNSISSDSVIRYFGEDNNSRDNETSVDI
ncbi:hypothetical protein [Pectobacterium sp. CHL-2024]|uniref:hypothetical protein n=1 Tax=Pectobacterium sp. CHL-2024 TaxID=3377079 RepID=UPI0037FD2E2F